MADKLLKYDVAMKSTKTVWQMETPRCYTGDENTVTFDFNITDLEAADLVGVIPNVYLYMRDGSFFQNGPADGVEITGTIVNYTMKGNEGKHSGIARAQLVLVWDDEINPPEKLTSQLYDFEVVSGLENKVAVEVMIQDWTTLTREARMFIDTSSDEVDALKGELQTAINTANASLGEFDVALETGIVAANLAEKLEDFEEINNSRLLSTEQQLAEMSNQVDALVLKPLYVETFASMGRYGIGTPSGVANYTGGNYVCTISGNAGDSFVTVTGGVIADGGGIWTAVIQDDTLKTHMNKVIGISGSTFTLVEPLTVTITNGKIGNLHDAPLGLHYTELGYFAFAQHIYNTNIKHSERVLNDKQFVGTDSSSFWQTTTSWSSYNNVTNVNNAGDNTLAKYGRAGLVLNLADPTHMAVLDYVAKEKGYLEMFLSSEKPSVIEYYKNGVLVQSIPLDHILQRVTLDFEYGETLKVKVFDAGASGGNVNSLRIGNTTFWLNRSILPAELISPNDKVVYIGDSWGVYHTAATTRELTRLMTADGGTPTVLNYSRGGHSTNYALDGFEEYVVANHPDKVIIEYYCNDFASIGGTNLGTFTAVDGTQKSLNVTTLTQYLENMNKMVEIAIQNGIQPIIIMASVTDAITRTQEFSDIISSIWLGDTLNKPSIETNEMLVKTIQQSGSTSYGNRLEIIGTEENALDRQGVVTDTSAAITAGNIATYKNNGVTKAGVGYDGTFKGPQVKMTPITNYNDVPLSEDGRGTIYFVDTAVNYGGGDEFYVVIKNSVGAYVRKKLSLID